VRRVVALLGAAGVALAAAGGASAHAIIRSTEPAFRERLERSPARVVIRFDQAVTPVANALEVFTSDGRLVSFAARAAGDRALSARLPRLPRGAYTVRWRTISRADGHVVSGVFTFGVRVPAPEPTDAFGAAGPTRTEHVVRWLYFLSLALVIGGLAFRLLVVRGPLPPRAERRFYLVVGAGVVGALEAGILAFLLRSQDALQLPANRFLYADLSPIAGGTRFGIAVMAMTLGLAAVAALLVGGWLTDRREPLWAALAVALAFASGLSLSGHQAGEPGSSWLTQGADFVHLTAAMLWLGGLAQLALVVWPLAPAVRREAFLRFARLAPVLIAALLAAGVYMSVLRLPAVSDLWSESYGRILLVKLALVALALSWGGVHHMFVRPILQRGGGGGGPRVGRSLLGESAVAVSILLVAAVLVDSKPPEPAPPAPTQASTVAPG
jgi:copper transport protein